MSKKTRIRILKKSDVVITNLEARSDYGSAMTFVAGLIFLGSYPETSNDDPYTWVGNYLHRRHENTPTGVRRRLVLALIEEKDVEVPEEEGNLDSGFAVSVWYRRLMETKTLSEWSSYRKSQYEVWGADSDKYFSAEAVDQLQKHYMELREADITNHQAQRIEHWKRE